MSVSQKQVKILFWTPANMNQTDGSTSFVTNSIKFLAGLPNVITHVILATNIKQTKSKYPSSLRKLNKSTSNLRILEPKQLNTKFQSESYKIKEETELENLILQLHKKHNYTSIFIRSDKLLTHPTFFERIPNIHLFFWHSQFKLPTDRIKYLYQKCKSIWCSSPIVQNRFQQLIITPHTQIQFPKITYFMPVAHPILNPTTLSKSLPPVIKLVYAGKFRKEYFIEEMIDGFSNMRKKSEFENKIELHIYGDSFDQSYKDDKDRLLKKLNNTKGLIYHGSVGNDEIDSELQKYHISLSIRGPIHHTCGDISNKMITSAKLGIPCFSNKSLINADFYGEQYNGYTETADDMITNLTKYINDPAIYYQDRLISIQACEKYSYGNHKIRILPLI
jgi:glycosyltransferase involved in cell wall biosynthesis